MAVYRCKMCGGTIEFEPGSTVGVCDSCGTKQTLPKTDSEVLSNLFNRANNLRLKCEFDKAEQIYEKIVEQDDSEAEAHWGIVLCKYGIEYVEDPKTFERIPTCHRTLYEPITSDVDYLATIDYSDASQQVIYEKEARAIDRIQKGILEIVRNEKPFDVFICYKETDENGKRTVDSAIANDIYYQLTQEGLKVFYAPITLEDKVGHEYEPYIFAALNSAKVMLVIGTKPEYFSAVWVKNEWSRFMKLMKTDRSKLLIPCYRDMDAYDLPKEFAHLQAQDMGKIGFINDVVRGIRKVISPDSVKTAVPDVTAPVTVGIVPVAPLLKRAFLFLEDGDWSSADEYFEKVLDLDPENAQAYLGKLMGELHVHHQEDLPNCEQPFNTSNNYLKAVRFGGDKIAGMLSGYIDHIKERNELEQITAIYDRAVDAVNNADSEAGFKAAAEMFKTIQGFRDADILAEQCLDKAEACRKDDIYASARSQMTRNAVGGYEVAIKMFSTISGWKDANEQIQICQLKIEEIKAKDEINRLENERKTEELQIKAEKEAKLKKRKWFISIGIIAAVAAFAVLWVIVIHPMFNDMIFNSALKAYEEKDYYNAYIKFHRIDSYKDSHSYAEKCYLDYLKNGGLNSLVLGEELIFGSYEQDTSSVGKEDVEWIVLAKVDNRILVISKYALDCDLYMMRDFYDISSSTWEESYLRKWLNSDFLNDTFNSEERSMIPTVTVSADKNPKYYTDPGQDTDDQIFLLSVIEYQRYCKDIKTQACIGTDFAYSKKINKDTNGYCWWWLRSPGNGTSVAVVNNDGKSITYQAANIRNGGIRPVMWLTIIP